MPVNPEENPISPELSELSLSTELPSFKDKDQNVDEISSISDVTPSTNNLDESPSIVDVTPTTKNTNKTVEEQQEQTRSQLARFLINIFALTIGGSFALFISLVILSVNIDEKKAENLDKTSILVKDLITLIITSQTGLIGSALGFYFGSRNNNSK